MLIAAVEQEKKAKMRQYQFLHNTGLEWQLPTAGAYNLVVV